MTTHNKADELQEQIDVTINYEKNDQIIERENVPNSPFLAVGNKEKGYFVTLGQLRLSDTYDTMQEAIDTVPKFKREHWEFEINLITSLSYAVYKSFINQNKNNHQ